MDKIINDFLKINEIISDMTTIVVNMHRVDALLNELDEKDSNRRKRLYKRKKRHRK